MKKLLSVLLVLLMVVAIAPVGVFAEEDGPVVGGYIHSDMHGARAVSRAYEKGDMETYRALTGTSSRDTLPTSYDSRNYNCITSVKNQGSYGTCWAFAAMGSLEAYMIKHGIPVGTGSAATTSLNLSETQHVFFSYTSAYDAEGMLTGDKTTITQSGTSNGFNMGGNGEMSAYTLQRWCGPADENVSALSYNNASSVANSGLGSQYAYQYNDAHTQNSVWIPATDIEGVKRAIMEYGAGNISYYAGSSYSTYSYTYQCTIDTSSQSSSSHKWANHAITLIGWDDSIAASNFSPNKPSGSGGWLCKNSWGTSYFNQGYMYISYEDTSVLEGYIYFFDAEALDNYDHNYQYDGTNNLVTAGKGWNSSNSAVNGFANNTKVANVFTAKGSEMLQAVAYCNWDEGLTYTLQVYKNPTTGNPSSGTLVDTQTGYLTYAGYYTIPLETPVILSEGDTFSVVFTQSCPTADDYGYYIHTPYDSTFSDSSLIPVSYTHTNHGNTSYYQEPNGSWTDCPNNGDYRIKAYTDDYENPYVVTAVSNNNAYGTVSVVGNVINCTPANGYYVASAEVISGTATVTVNGNTVTVNASSDCTVRVNFAVKPQYTVNFVASGVAQGSQTAYVQDAITLPNSVSVNPDGWTFVGWVDAQLAETTNAPEYYAPGAQYVVNGNATLYALYIRTEGSGETVYQLLTAAPANWAGKYVITCGTDAAYVLKGLSGNTSYESASAGGTVTLANSGMTLDGNVLRNVGSAYIFTAAAVSGGYTLQNQSTSTYMGSYNNYLYSRSTYSSSYCNWTLEYDASNACMKVANSASSSYPYMVKGSNSYFVVNNTYTTNKTQFWGETTLQTVFYNTDPVAAAPTYYTVNFYDWDGALLSTQQVIEGGAATAPTVPGREGYTFTGWDVAFNNVQSDLNVTAQYTINSYTLTVYYKYADGTTASATYTGSYNYGAPYSVVSPVIEGYTADVTVVQGTMGAANVTVTVTYTEDEPITGNLPGDVDCNGHVDFADISMLYLYILGQSDITDQGRINADFDQDGNIAFSDVSAIYMYILGL